MVEIRIGSFCRNVFIIIESADYFIITIENSLLDRYSSSCPAVNFIPY